MDISDLRRLSITTMVLAGVFALWLLFVGLHDAELFQWAWPETALGWFGMKPWLWTGFGIGLVFVAISSLLTLAVDEAPPGLAKGKLRQVQCQDCKAVFFVHDAGNRPLTHQCPSCKALGYYDGKAPAVGKPPQAKAPAQITKLAMTCNECKHKFRVTDTGHRPLRVECPQCNSRGAIR